MLFRRRTPQKLARRVRVAIWPSNGWRRSVQYFSKRVMRLSGSPHAVALGFATGVFVSWTPFVGFHIVMGVALAFLFGGNLVAAALGTVVGNPLTFPVMWWSTFTLGNRMLAHDPAEFSFARVADAFAHQPLSGILPLITPMTVGSLPLGVASAIVSYAIVAMAVSAYQTARRRRLSSRRELQNAAAGEREPAEEMESA